MLRPTWIRSIPAMSLISLPSVVNEVVMSHCSGCQSRARTFTRDSVPQAATSPMFTSWIPPAKSPARPGHREGGIVRPTIASFVVRLK